jgi:hypothetical protein
VHEPALTSFSVALSKPQFDDLRGRLFGLLISVSDRLTERDARLIQEFIDVGEFGLAWNR